MAISKQGNFVRQILAQQTDPHNIAAQRCLSLALEILSEHREKFDRVVRLIPSIKNIRQSYSKIISELLSEDYVCWCRLVVVFAFGIYIQERFCINLEAETETVVDRQLYVWLMRQEGSMPRCNWSLMVSVLQLCAMINRLSI